MMRKILLTAALAGALLAPVAASTPTLAAASGAPALPTQSWSFQGWNGSFDRASAQRGLQVYREVCSGCHSLRLVAFRHLAPLGYSDDELKAMAAEMTVEDGPDSEGEMFERDGKPSDYFPSPFPNEEAAAAGNGGAVPPDLSLMTKARKKGHDYLNAMMVGYEELPENFKEMEEYAYLPEDFAPSDTLYFNPYFPGYQIAMPPPLIEDGVEYADGTPATVEQQARDVVTFLAWAAEPELEQRKSMGLAVMIFLVIFCGILFAAKRRVWADLH